jgi:glycosyl hydrolase family 76
MTSHLVHPRPIGALLGCLAALAYASLALGSAAAPAVAASRYPGAATRALSPAQLARRASARSRAARLSAGASLRARAAAGKRARKKPRKPALHGNPARALLAFEAMQKYYYLQGSGLYEGEPFSYLWPFSQALAATVSMANIAHLGVSFAHELQARMYGLHYYLDTNNSGASEAAFTSTLPAFDGTVAPPTGPGGAKYYDDNEWVGIELVRAYKLTHEPSALANAEMIMAFEMAAWQTDPEQPCPGGIPFSNAAENTDRNTTTTAPAAELAVQLYQITGNVGYLQFAERAYLWVRACLLESNGLYADHISAKGVEPMIWSYNQGSMIGAATLLYQATHNNGYIYQARQSAAAALAYFTPERLASENPFFPSVYFRDLLYLDSVTHDPPGKKIAQNYVDYAWQHLRLSDNVFVAGSPAAAQLLTQAAIVQIYALLSSPASSYF